MRKQKITALFTLSSYFLLRDYLASFIIDITSISMPKTKRNNKGKRQGGAHSSASNAKKSKNEETTTNGK